MAETPTVTITAETTTDSVTLAVVTEATAGTAVLITGCSDNSSNNVCIKRGSGIEVAKVAVVASLEPTATTSNNG